LEKCKNENATITDSLSGKKLDIKMQCVNLSVASADGNGGSEVAVGWVRNKLGNDTLATGDQTKARFGTGLVWVQGTVSEMVDSNAGGQCHIDFSGATVFFSPSKCDAVTAEQLAGEGTEQDLYCRDQSGVFPVLPQNQTFRGSIRQKNGAKQLCVAVQEAEDLVIGVVPEYRTEVEVRDGERGDVRGVLFTTDGGQLDPSTEYQVECAGNEEGATRMVPFKGKELKVLTCTQTGYALRRTVTPFPSTGLISQPVLLTGKAASGKSTFTKQYAYDTARVSLDEGSIRQVTLKVTVIDFAQVIEEAKKKEPNLNADDDLLGLYLSSSKCTDDESHRQLLRDMHRGRRLVLLLDGMDEAGKCRELIEAYVSCRLVTEVRLCVTARPQGIAKKTQLFDPFFVGVEVCDLNEDQQASIVRGRFEAKPMEGADTPSRIQSFKEQVGENGSFRELAKNPLLLNLMVSVFMQYERDGKGGGFGQNRTEIYKSATNGLLEKHSPFAKFSQLFSDEQANKARIVLAKHNNKGYDEVSERTVREWAQNNVIPLIRGSGKLIFLTNFVRKEHADPDENNELDRFVAKYKSDKTYVHIQHSRKNSLDQLGSHEGGKSLLQGRFYAEIKGSMAKGWLGLWESVMELVPEVADSRIIIFEAKKSTANSAAELVVLGSKFKDVAENKKQLPFYSSKNMEPIPLDKIVQLGEKAIRDLGGGGGEADATSELILPFLRELSYALLTKGGDQFRNFDNNFLEESVFATGVTTRAVWNHLQPYIRKSQFALIVWEPSGDSDSYRISHLTFQEYFAASVVAEKGIAADGWGVFRKSISGDAEYEIGSLVKSSKFLVTTEMCLELLQNSDRGRAGVFASEMLQPDEKGMVKVEGVSAVDRSGVNTLLLLVEAVAEGRQLHLEMKNCGLNDAAISAFDRFANHGSLSALTGLNLSDNRGLGGQ
jgi:hypothetical protein